MEVNVTPCQEGSIARKRKRTPESWTRNKIKRNREDNEDVLILSFDCQKNQPLPKIPDQAIYCSRQVYVYNFTVVKGYSKSTINSQTVTIYCWTEKQFSKGANEVVSCLPPNYNDILQNRSHEVK
ncbi:hypothetical protein ABEB36_013919 [Hypothenemus hampei]|uniref:Uncharacterized protein n=1 Tax=Hypothenemus hampei TaxID=57062 RepID=A0ABD1E613_HYPHA